MWLLHCHSDFFFFFWSRVNLPSHLCALTLHLFILASSFTFPPPFLQFPPYFFSFLLRPSSYLYFPLFSSLLPPALFAASHNHLLLLLLFFLFPSPWLGSIGTREGVIQKNLSGLLPVRDFRLDPSLMYSLPLLALSPNLLVVWIFLSMAYFLAKLRCS